MHCPVEHVLGVYEKLQLILIRDHALLEGVPQPFNFFRVDISQSGDLFISVDLCEDFLKLGKLSAVFMDS